jgi:hypothetical protein
MKIIFVHRRAAIAQGACAGVHFVVRVVGPHYELLDFVGAEMDDMGLDVVDPDDGMVTGHRAWSAEKSMQIALSTL